MTLRIAIKKRDIDYGLFTWRRSDDFEVKTLLANQESILVKYKGKVSAKKVDYKYRRFSVGKRVFDQHAGAEFFVLKKSGNTFLLSFE